MVVHKTIKQNGTDRRKYSDETWEGPSLVKKDVEAALDKYNKREYTQNELATATPPRKYTVSLGPEKYGGYRTSQDGTKKYKEYNILIYADDSEKPFMGGVIDCMAAGTVEEPFKEYDMAVMF